MRKILTALSLLLFVSPCAFATIKDDIGYTDLQAMLGANTPTGAGINATMVEAYVDSKYAPSVAGKTINLMSGASNPSSHATTVGNLLFGATGISPAVDNINVWQAGNFIGSGFLKTNSTTEPVVETHRIQNHSWAGGYDSVSSNTDALRRFDYAIQRDGFVAVVGLNNGSSTTVPALMCNSYNAIVVGRSDGGHSRGGTTLDGTGRVVPHIVAPGDYTSYSTPLVGSAAALLLETADANAGLANARHNSEVIKSVLMAGATKSEFLTWSRTQTRPLDSVYGAGELNILNSYNILVAGEQEKSTSATVSSTGWDFSTTTSGSDLYFFEVTDQHELSAILTWNRVITDGYSSPSWGNPQSSLANLDLKLYSADGFVLGDLVDQSISSIDNVEHIYSTYLAAGRYAFEIAGVSGVEYSLAWQTIPEPTTLGLLAVSFFAVIRRRRNA